MRVTIDAAGRITVPKALRDELGMSPGSTVDISRHGAGLQLVPGGRTDHIVERDGAPVITGESRLDDETLFGLIDAGRR